MRVVHSSPITDEAEVGSARRAVHRFAASLGFGADALAELDIVVQEIGTNAARYATGGGRLFWTTPLGDEPGVELFYWDRGPGIYDIDRALRDGVSTSGSLGGGLGALRRLLDEFDIYSTVRGVTSRLYTRRTTFGTAILGRKWLAPARAAEAARADEFWPARRLGVWSRCRRHEDVNGDAYYVGRHNRASLYAVIDGLGHGYGANVASRAAVETLAQWRGEPLDEVFAAAHGALRSTRGAVMAACVVDPVASEFTYAGVGNADVRVFGNDERVRPVPNNGTLGLRLSNLRLWRHRWSEGATLVMTTDGLSASWDVTSYPGLASRSPQLFAGVLLRDFGRDSDDATVLVAR
ncbi:MAG TPA: ATP-binding protein [Pyrinomonadaceae bacterium]|nr:ATP-binding protein [Pyrinomonadaceae bacterium]